MLLGNYLMFVFKRLKGVALKNYGHYGWKCDRSVVMGMYTCSWCGRKFSGSGAGILLSNYCGKKCKNEAKGGNNQNAQGDNNSGSTKFHGLYCLLIGWWLSMFLICMIFPLFSSGGRSLIKKAFGIW